MPLMEQVLTYPPPPGTLDFASVYKWGLCWSIFFLERCFIHYCSSFLFWRLYCVSFLENLITCLSCFGDCIVSPSSRISLLVFFVLAIVLCLLPRESHYLSFLFWRLYCVSFLENLITCLFLFWRLYCVSFLENLITCLFCFGDCIVSPFSRISLLVLL